MAFREFSIDVFYILLHVFLLLIEHSKVFHRSTDSDMKKLQSQEEELSDCSELLLLKVLFHTLGANRIRP